jgi:hypothetical protein
MKYLILTLFYAENSGKSENCEFKVFVDFLKMNPEYKLYKSTLLITSITKLVRYEVYDYKD